MNVVNVGYGSTNYYVLGPPDRRLLVDAGMPGTLSRLLANLRRMDVTLGSVRHLLCTHYHPDHAGIAQDLKRAGVGLLVLDFQRAALPAFNTFLRRHGWGGSEIGLEDNIALTLEQSRTFLGRLGIAGEVVSTPGHSDDSVTLVLDDGTAFTGDLPPLELAAGPDEPLAARSWELLRRLGVARVHPGHGPVHELPAA